MQRERKGFFRTEDPCSAVQYTFMQLPWTQTVSDEDLAHLTQRRRMASASV